MEEVLCISAQWSLTAELCCHGAGFCCFSGGRRFSFVPRVRCSAAWKLAVLVASAPSAQLPGPAPKNQSGCPCKEHRPSNSPWGWTRCWSLFWQAVTSSDPPPSLTRGLFPSPAPFRDMVPERRCSGARCVFQHPAWWHSRRVYASLSLGQHCPLPCPVILPLSELLPVPHRQRTFTPSQLFRQLFSFLFWSA